MQNFLGIIGSKRKSGNCEVVVKEISRQLPVEHRLTLLRLPDFDIRHCSGCYRCLVKEDRCVIEDDLPVVLEAIAAADALILAVPTYFLAAHSCLKVLIDRGLSFYSMADRLWEKPAVGVGVAGIRGKEGSTLLDIEKFFATILADNKQSEIIYGALPGETMLSKANRQVAKDLGQRLFGLKKMHAGPHCSLCGGQTFRFLPDGRVRCMLCSESGNLQVRDGQLALDIEMGEHPVLANRTAALKHRDWLLGMVARFSEDRDKLKAVRREFADKAEYVKPGER